MERQRTTGYRPVANSRPRQGYRDMTTASATVSVPDYTRPYPSRMPNPVPKMTPKPAVTEKVADKTLSRAKRKQITRTFCLIAGVFVMCLLMIYRYAMILESNDRITRLTQQIADMEYDTQFLATKLDSALELGVLENYATEELGMIRPDASQVFYVNITMEDTTVTEDDIEENRALQGAPGALVHAIRVLK